MKKLQCGINEMFGSWRVVDNSKDIHNGHSYVLCECKCGKQKHLCLSDLINNRTTGCRSCKAQERKVSITIGNQYKDWVVIQGPRLSRHHNIQWQVLCNVCKKSTRWIQGNELINPNKCVCCRKCASKKMVARTTKMRGRVGDLMLTQYTRLLRSAKSRNILFNITIEYMWNLFQTQGNRCNITGDIIHNIKQASLDRIDSNVGYIEGNVQWVTKQANVSKHILSHKEFVLFCQKVVNHANQQPS